MFFVCHPKILRKRCLQFLLGVKMAPRETENNAYAKFWGDKQRTIMIRYGIFWGGQFIYVYYWRCMGALILIGHPSHAKVYPFAGHILQRDHYTFLGNCPPTPPLSQH